MCITMHGSNNVNLSLHVLLCRMFSFGVFSGVRSLIANVSKHCLFQLHRWVGTKCGSGEEFSQTLPHFVPTHLWRWNRKSVPKRWLFKLHTPENNPKENTTFKTRRKSEIKNFRLYLPSILIPSSLSTNSVSFSHPFHVFHTWPL
jgi:hypothetical protein